MFLHQKTTHIYFHFSNCSFLSLSSLRCRLHVWAAKKKEALTAACLAFRSSVTSYRTADLSRGVRRFYKVRKQMQGRETKEHLHSAETKCKNRIFSILLWLSLLLKFCHTHTHTHTRTGEQKEVKPKDKTANTLTFASLCASFAEVCLAGGPSNVLTPRWVAVMECLHICMCRIHRCLCRLCCPTHHCPPLCLP